jgi:hypothetical protein
MLYWTETTLNKIYCTVKNVGTVFTVSHVHAVLQKTHIHERKHTSCLVINFITLEHNEFDLQEFILAADFNRMTHVRDYVAHQARVTSIHFALNCEWMLSIGRDKMFQYHCSETGRHLGSFQSGAWCTALQYPF